MLKNIGDKFKRRRKRTPQPLMPGEAVDGEFIMLRDGDGGKRYDLVAADRRTREIADARRTLGLEGEDVEGALEDLEDLDDAAES